MPAEACAGGSAVPTFADVFGKSVPYLSANESKFGRYSAMTYSSGITTESVFVTVRIVSLYSFHILGLSSMEKWSSCTHPKPALSQICLSVGG